MRRKISESLTLSVLFFTDSDLGPIWLFFYRFRSRTNLAIFLPIPISDRFGYFLPIQISD